LKRHLVGLSLAATVLAGCAGPTSAPATQSPGPSAPKTITAATLISVASFGPWDLGQSASGGLVSMSEIHANGLVSNDVQGNAEARLAERLPSLEDGSITLLQDGRMRTTWKLRSDVRWHDGVPFEAEDLVFSWRVFTDPTLPVRPVNQIALIESVEATDPHTLVMTWRSPYFRALAIGLRELYPFPSHVLAESFAADQQAFQSHPYWTADYVHLGPFRLVDFGLGENLVFQRFDGYFRGKPRVDRIILRAVGDPNALFAGLRAGAIDIAAERTLPTDLFAQLRDEWASGGGGTVVVKPDNWRYLLVQFNREWARPPELSQDLRTRRGLLYGLDRDALSQLVLPGFSDTESDTFLWKSDPRSATVGLPFAGYRYDLRRAAQELAAVGWRVSDGALLTSVGERVKLELRGSAVDAKEMAFIANGWRQLGIEVAEVTIPSALSNDREYSATFPGLRTFSRGSGDEIFPTFDSRQHATPRNRFIGTNVSAYANPSLDGLIDRLASTLDDHEQGRVLQQMGILMADDLPALPTYFRVSPAAVVHGVTALDDFAGSIGPGYASRNAHLWDRIQAIHNDI
jgi:peptide/nickel transport system substrate-binding protein